MGGAYWHMTDMAGGLGMRVVVVARAGLGTLGGIAGHVVAGRRPARVRERQRRRAAGRVRVGVGVSSASLSGTPRSAGGSSTPAPSTPTLPRASAVRPRSVRRCSPWRRTRSTSPASPAPAATSCTVIAAELGADMRWIWGTVPLLLLVGFVGYRSVHVSAKLIGTIMVLGFLPFVMYDGWPSLAGLGPRCRSRRSARRRCSPVRRVWPSRSR